MEHVNVLVNKYISTIYSDIKFFYVVLVAHQVIDMYKETTAN